MAVTTTTTQNDVLVAERIAARNLESPKPKVVVARLSNVDMDLIESGELAKSYPRDSDIGAAGSATEGNTISATTTLGMGTQLTLTPTEAAAIRSDVTDKLARKRAQRTVKEAIDSGNIAALNAIFERDIVRQRNACWEKLEVDHNALLDDFSTSVGSTGTAMTLAKSEQALLSLTNAETNREMDFVYVIPPAGISDLRNEIGITSGGVQGAVWTQDIQSLMTLKPELASVGLVGALWGIPVYQPDTSVNPAPNAGADVAGALMVAGFGHPEGDRPGALCLAIGEELHTRFDGVQEDRATKIITIWEYAVGERADDYGVGLLMAA